METSTKRIEKTSETLVSQNRRKPKGTKMDTTRFDAWVAKMYRCNFVLAPDVTAERFEKINWDLMLGNGFPAKDASAAKSTLGDDLDESHLDCTLIPGRIGNIGDIVVSGPKIMDAQLKIMGLPSFIVVAHYRGSGVTMSDADVVGDSHAMWWTAIRPAPAL